MFACEYLDEFLDDEDSDGTPGHHTEMKETLDPYPKLALDLTYTTGHVMAGLKCFPLVQRPKCGERWSCGGMEMDCTADVDFLCLSCGFTKPGIGRATEERLIGFQVMLAS